MIIVNAFPNCCAAQVASNFGGGHEGQIEDYTKQAVIDFLKKKMTQLKRDQLAVLFCCPTTTQPNAVAAIRELGFYGYEEDEKGCAGYSKRHRMFPFFIPLMEWDEKAFNERYNPEEDDYVNQKCYHEDFTYTEVKANPRW